MQQKFFSFIGASLKESVAGCDCDEEENEFVEQRHNGTTSEDRQEASLPD